MPPKQQPSVLIAEDEPNDALLLKFAFEKSQIAADLHIAHNGDEVIDYLQRQGRFAGEVFSFPCIFFLDLKMPGLNGLDVLRWLKSHPEFKVIPTVVLSASALDSDVWEAYTLGANSYLVKPTSFEDLAGMVKLVFDYWSICAVPSLPYKNMATT